MSQRGRRRRCSIAIWPPRFRAWALDYLYVLTSWCRALLRPGGRWPDPAPGAGKVPVLILPGVYESWRFLEPLARALLREGHPVHIVPLGLNRGSLRAASVRVRQYLRAHTGAEPVVLVAHSKGGLIGKQVMVDLTRRHALDGSARSAVAGMVTLNTPFAGSRYAPLLPMAELRALGPWALRQLGAERRHDERIVAVRAAWDPHIPGAPDLPGARNVVVPAMGHFRIIADDHTLQVVLDAVGEVGRWEPVRG